MPNIVSEKQWFRRLKKAAMAGEVIDLRPKDEAGALDGLEHANLWNANRVIPANAIRRILTLSEPDVKQFDPTGLHIRGACIEGSANWNRVNFPRRLTFDQCVFSSIVKLRDARISTLGLTGCRLQGLHLDAAHIDGGVVAAGLTVTGETSAAGAIINGQFNLSGAALTNTNGRALVLDSARISMGLYATDLTVAGEVRAAGAQISDQLNLRGATLINTDGRAIVLDGAQINGGLFAEELTAHGETRAAGIRVRGLLNLSHATLINTNRQALVLEGAHIEPGLLAEGLKAAGEIGATGAQISGQLNLSDATLDNLRGQALTLDRAQIGSLVAIGLTAYGETRAAGTRISGQLDLSNATLGNIDGQAITLDGAQIGNLLDLSGATLTHAMGTAITLDGTHIDSDLYAPRLTVNGEVRAIGAQISGELNLTDAVLTRPWTKCVPGDDHTPALTLDRTQIDSGLFANRLTVNGEVRAIGAQISGRVELNAAALTNLNGDALTLESAMVDHLILLPAQVTGNIHLDLARIQILQLPSGEGTDKDPRAKAFAGSTLSAAGWSITDLRGAIRRDWKVARSYLEHTPPSSISLVQDAGFIPQPWFEIADVYESIGHPDNARKLRLHTEKQITRKTRRGTQAIRRLYDMTVGYGYRPSRPVWWLLGVLVTAGLLIWTNQDLFLPADRTLEVTANDVCTNTSGYACFNTIGYTLQNVVPAASGPFRPDWILSTSGAGPIALGILMTVLRLLAWGFAALTLAAMTGLLRKR